MLTVACVNVGSFCGRGAQYVNALANSIHSAISERFEFFVLDESRHSGFWPKIELFNHLWTRQRVLYLDLDCVVRGSLDSMLSALEGVKFGGLKRPGKEGFWSDLMYWEGDHSDIWLDWNSPRGPNRKPPGGDRIVIGESRPDAIDLCDLFPTEIAWFGNLDGKNSGLTPPFHSGWKPPVDSKIVVMQGFPRPHQLARGSWLPPETERILHESQRVNGKLRSA